MLRPLLALLTLLTIAAPADSQSTAPPTVTIAVSSFRIAPDVIRLGAGQPVRLLFMNLSGSNHDFSARAFFGGARIIAGAAENGVIKLAGHGQASVTLIAPKGVYKAHCSHFAHSMMGMKAKIIVD